jgi:hypothetical protein
VEQGPHGDCNGILSGNGSGGLPPGALMGLVTGSQKPDAESLIK